METYSKSLLIGATNEINLSNLSILMLNHISIYAFSNRDYFKNVKKNFDPSKVIDKLNNNKYGLCMELSYSFSEFLTKQGYENYLVRCFKPKHSSLDAERIFFDIFHLAIIVIINDKKYFVDVAFGEHFDKPILLENGIQNDNIEIKIISDNDYDLIINQKLILNIKDKKTELWQIINNYVIFFGSRPDEFPLCGILYERIYEKSIGHYIQPLFKSAL